MSEIVGKGVKRKIKLRPLGQLLFCVMLIVTIILIKKDLKNDGPRKIENTFRIIEGKPLLKKVP